MRYTLEVSFHLDAVEDVMNARNIATAILLGVDPTAAAAGVVYTWCLLEKSKAMSVVDAAPPNADAGDDFPRPMGASSRR